MKLSSALAALKPLKGWDRQIRISKVRCFARSQSVRLGKITVLVGENSTGKSTFSAAVSMLSQLLAPRHINFNSAPYFLGSYQDIATRDSLRANSASNFSIELSGTIGPQSGTDIFTTVSKLFEGSHSIASFPKTTYCVRTTFETKGGQPSATNSKIDLGSRKLQLAWMEDAPDEVHSISDGEYTFEFSDVKRPQEPWMRSAGSLFFDYLSYSFRRSFDRLDEIFGDNGKTSLSYSDLNTLSSQYDLLRETLESLTVHSIAPIRSRPKRTYDPIKSSPTPEGEHVPMLLSRMYRENSNQWENLKKQIDKFGQTSGLFRELRVRSFGESASDPFQLTVRVKNDTVNLVDVGYGISQVLPIIVDTITQDTAKMFVLQQPEVHLHPQAQATLASFMLEHALNSDQGFVIETHSDQIIDRLRIEIRDRELDPRILSLLFFESGDNGVHIHEIELDDLANLTNAPPSYRQFFLRERYALLGLRR